MAKGSKERMSYTYVRVLALLTNQELDHATLRNIVIMAYTL